MKHSERMRNQLKAVQMLDDFKTQDAQELRAAYVAAGYDPEVMKIGVNVSCHTLENQTTLYIVAGKVVHRSRNLTRRFLESGGAELLKGN